MKHPPIPPNSPYFQRNDVGDWFKYPVIGGLNGLNHAWLGISEETCETAMIWRPIIAAVAADAWHEEMERLKREDEQGEYGAAYMDAEVAMRAWRAWGKAVS